MVRPKKYEHGWPSVTEILNLIDKPGLRYWYGKYGTTECNKMARESQNFGHHVHSAIEKFLPQWNLDEAKKEIASTEEMLTFRKMVNIIKRKRLKGKRIEEPLYHEEYQYGGTPDYYQEDTIYDWKTSNPRTVSKAELWRYKLQVAGYALMLPQITKGNIILVSRVQEVKDVSFEINDSDKEAFIGLRKIYQYIHGR